MRRRILIAFGLPLAALPALALPALAAPVGAAVSVERSVTGAGGGANGKLSAGDAVAQDEVVVTGNASSAQLRFLDDTQLSIGPLSSVKLDTFVFNPDKSAKTILVDLARGGFRFVSGKSGHESYVVRTPHATIGVRGTVFGIVVGRNRTIVTLKQGAVTVCPRSGRGLGCEELTRPEDAIVVTRTQALPAAPRKAGDPDFTEWCKGRAVCGLPQ